MIVVLWSGSTSNGVDGRSVHGKTTSYQVPNFRQALRPIFDRRIKLEFHGARITSDGGLLAYRELDDALGLTDMVITKRLDGRRGKNTRDKRRSRAQWESRVINLPWIHLTPCTASWLSAPWKGATKPSGIMSAD